MHKSKHWKWCLKKDLANEISRYSKVEDGILMIEKSYWKNISNYQSFMILEPTGQFRISTSTWKLASVCCVNYADLSLFLNSLIQKVNYGVLFLP